ncbi:hypothetical protein [Rhodanobacter lindaniclasticus]
MRLVLLALVVAYAIYIYGVYDVQHNPLARFPLPDFGCEYGSYFCSGVVLYHFRHAWRGHAGWFTAVLVVAGALMVVLDHGYAALFLLLPWGVIRFGTVMPRRGFAAPVVMATSPTASTSTPS